MTGISNSVTVPPEKSWLVRHGGLCHCQQDANKAQSVCQYLAAGCIQTPVRIAVINSPTAAAWSWPDGDIYVTRGLIARLTNQELDAAVAHEMGHLVNDHHVMTMAALTGENGDIDRESGADLTGCRILLMHGISPYRMVQMIQIVRVLHGSAVDQSMLQRIKFLKAELKSTYTSEKIAPPG